MKTAQIQHPLSTAIGVLCSAVCALISVSLNAAEAPNNCSALDPEVSRLLNGMSSNARLIDYSGVVTLRRGGDMQIMELTHQVRNGQASEQLLRLTGQDARVDRSAHPTSCMHPGHQLLRASDALGGSFCSLSAVYRFRIAPGERIAGRDAVRLRVEPRDMYRFGYVFDLDSETALMLRSSTMAQDQRVIEEFQFASLRMQPRSANQADVQYAASHPHPHETSHLRAGPGWDLRWLPAGFLATDSAPANSQRKSYTDGLASFSVFLEPLSTAINPGEGVERQGSTIAYTRGIVLQRRPVLVTVLGEIPTNTARMVADSVRLR